MKSTLFISIIAVAALYSPTIRAAERCPPASMLAPSSFAPTPWCTPRALPKALEASGQVVSPEAAIPTRTRACHLQYVGSHESAIVWSHQIVRYTGLPGGLRALNNPQNGSEHVRLIPWEAGDRVEYAVTGGLRWNPTYGYYEPSRAAGISPSGEVVVQPGEQLEVRADSLVQTVDGFVATDSQDVTAGDVRLGEPTGDPSRLGLTDAATRAYLLSPYLVIGKRGFSVHIAAPYGPPVPPSVRIAIAVQERLHPRAYPNVNRWECGFDEVREGDNIVILGGPPALTEYYVRAISYLHLTNVSKEVVVSPLNSGSIIKR